MMLGVLIFNMGGYLLLFNYCIDESDRFTNEQISKGFYKIDDLVEIKIPVRLPYVQEQRQYEQISGQIQLQGNCYNYVALKMTRDTMYVKCIPNYTKTKLIASNIIVAKDVKDTPLSQKNHVPGTKKTGLDSDYINLINLFDFSSATDLFQIALNSSTPKIQPPHLTALGQPPDVIV